MSEKQFRAGARDSDAVLCVLSLDELKRLWIGEIKNNNISLAEAEKLWESWRGIPQFAAQYAAVADDMGLAARLVKDLGHIGGRVRYVQYSGRVHVIFKGYAGLRKVLNGTRYLASNPKVVQMGVGRAGAVRAIRGGAALTVVLVSAFRVFDYLMSDNQTLTYLLGSLAMDFIKVGISAAAAVAAVGVASTTAVAAFAVGPLLVAIVVGALIGFVLDMVDDRFAISAQLIDAIDRVAQRAEQSLRSHVDRVQDRIAKLAEDLAEAVIQSVLCEIEEYVRERMHRVIWIQI